jgi:hypothetical protein
MMQGILFGQRARPASMQPAAHANACQEGRWYSTLWSGTNKTNRLGRTPERDFLVDALCVCLCVCGSDAFMHACPEEFCSFLFHVFL